MLVRKPQSENSGPRHDLKLPRGGVPAESVGKPAQRVPPDSYPGGVNAFMAMGLGASCLGGERGI